MSTADPRPLTELCLRETAVDPDPLRQFAQWLEEALAAVLAEPYAMTLATATPDGQPAARLVLLRGFDARGFVFFTNFESRKGRELADNPRAALVFWWPELQRQVRVEGRVEVVAPEESDAYFRDRPHGHRLAALASPQSQVIPDRTVLEERMRNLEAQYADAEVPRPAHWGGYRVVPARIEFWQGRPNRVHDRLLYLRQADGTWQLQRLAP